MELLGNPLVIGLISAVIAIVFFFIHTKLSQVDNKENTTQPIEYFKMALLGFIIGTSSVLLYELAGETKIKLDQDILTGNPDF